MAADDNSDRSASAWVKRIRQSAVVVILGLLVVALINIGSVINAVQTVSGTIWPSVGVYDLSADDLTNELTVYGLPASIQLPQEWDIDPADDDTPGLRAHDENMTISVAAAGTLAANAKTSRTEVTRVSFREADIIEQRAPAQRDEYTAAGRHVMQLRALIDGDSAVVARCSVTERAWAAYERACARVLGTFAIFDNIGMLPLHLEYRDLAESNIWRSPPAFIAGSWDFLAEHWAEYDLNQPHSVDLKNPGTAFDNIYEPSEIFTMSNTLGGKPMTFAGTADVMQRLADAGADRTRWVIQVIDPNVDGWRAYVQFNGPSDFTAAGGDLVFVLNGLAVAGGAIDRTDGLIDDTLYVYAQDVLILPSPEATG